MMVGKISGQNTGIHISAINQSIANKNEAISGGKKAENKIMAIISPAGKKQSMIEQLMKQKQDLTERMNSMSASASESGVNIQDQMEEYRKQLEALDEQILKLQMQQEDGEEDSKKTGIYEKPMTKEQAENKKMNDLMSLAASGDQAEVVASVKEQVDGRTNILKSEIKTGYGNIESKIAEVAELESRSADLASQVGKRIEDMNDEINHIRHEETIVSESDNPKEDGDIVKDTQLTKDKEDKEAQINEQEK